MSIYSTREMSARDNRARSLMKALDMKLLRNNSATDTCRTCFARHRHLTAACGDDSHDTATRLRM